MTLETETMWITDWKGKSRQVFILTGLLNERGESFMIGTETITGVYRIDESERRNNRKGKAKIRTEVVHGFEEIIVQNSYEEIMEQIKASTK